MAATCKIVPTCRRNTADLGPTKSASRGRFFSFAVWPSHCATAAPSLLPPPVTLSWDAGLTDAPLAIGLDAPFHAKLSALLKVICRNAAGEPLLALAPAREF